MLQIDISNIKLYLDNFFISYKMILQKVMFWYLMYINEIIVLVIDKFINFFDDVVQDSIFKEWD